MLQDLDYAEQILYRKRNGEFFLYGYGGARTGYAKTSGRNTWSGGESITPISQEDAMKWTEESTPDLYESIFGEIKEADGKKVVTFSIKESTNEQITRFAGEWECSRSEVIDRLIENA